MLKYIFNAFTGSFFRTIGRILAYGVIAGIIGYFMGQWGLIG